MPLRPAVGRPRSDAHEENRPTALLHLGDFDRHGTTRARWRGRSIEVEHGIPGETVRAEISGGRRPRGRILEVVEAAPDRVRAPCPYFREWQCGGCQWQHISYEGQLARKRAEVEAAMREVGPPYAVTAVHSLSDPWRYRSTAGIALGRHAGFRRHGSLAIVPIRDCPIAHPLIGRLMATLNDRLEAGALPNFHGRVRLDVCVSGLKRDQRLQVLIRPTEEKRSSAPELDALAATLWSLEEVEGVAILRPDGSIATLSGPLFAPTPVAGRPVSLSAGSFFQTNLLLLPTLIARLREESEPRAGKRIADLYGGVGIFGLFLADEAAEVVGIESDQVAVEAGRRTAEAWGLSNVRSLAAPVETALASLTRCDVVIVDPPRAGLTEPVIEALQREPPPLLLYVSCLAQSLARDLAQLVQGGFDVEHLELFDFYPQTYHVELLAVLRKR